VKKNAIMMIEFRARRRAKRSKNSRDSNFRGLHVRFRPILMTTMAGAAGRSAAALGTGKPDSELRRPLGSRSSAD